jgi:hypothetical protein
LVKEPSLAEELNDEIPDFGNEEATPDNATKWSTVYGGHHIDLHNGHWIISKDGKELHRANSEKAALAWIDDPLKKKPAKTSAKKPSPKRSSKRSSNVLDAG